MWIFSRIDMFIDVEMPDIGDSLRPKDSLSSTSVWILFALLDDRFVMIFIRIPRLLGNSHDWIP